jgi:hypothetical protein
VNEKLRTAGERRAAQAIYFKPTRAATSEFRRAAQCPAGQYQDERTPRRRACYAGRHYRPVNSVRRRRGPDPREALEGPRRPALQHPDDSSTLIRARHPCRGHPTSCQGSGIERLAEIELRSGNPDNGQFRNRQRAHRVCMDAPATGGTCARTRRIQVGVLYGPQAVRRVRAREQQTSQQGMGARTAKAR